MIPESSRAKLRLQMVRTQPQANSILLTSLPSAFVFKSVLCQTRTFQKGTSSPTLPSLQGVEYKLYTFFGIDDSGGDFLTELNLMRDVVMTGSLAWSLAVILTALVKYWYQAKNLSVRFSGQVRTPHMPRCPFFLFLPESVNYSSSSPCPYFLPLFIDP